MPWVQTRRGRDNKNSKMDDSKVALIKRDILRRDKRHGELAALYGVTKGTIRAISDGRSYFHVRPAEEEK